MTDKPKPKERERHCWCCGESMGIIQDRHYDRGDTCGQPQCERAARDAASMERDDAHERLDRDNGWNW